MPKSRKGSRKSKKTGADPQTTGGHDEQVGGARAQSANVEIPQEAIIKRQPAQPESEITETAEVKGDKSLQVIDILNNFPVEVFVVDASPLIHSSEDQLVFVQSNVTHEVLTPQRARGKFARDPEGTVLYNGRGFDEVNASAKYDLVDIVKLIELRGKHAKRKR